MITVSPGSRETPASHLRCKATVGWPECWTHFILLPSEFTGGTLKKKKSYRSLPRISGTKLPLACANPAFLRIKLCFIVDKNGVLQAGNNVFDAKTIPRGDSQKLLGSNRSKALPKLLLTFKTIISFYRESFKW